VKYEPAEPGRRRGRPRPGGEQRTTAEQRQRITRWFTRQVPTSWFNGAPEVLVDDDEILVMGTLAEPRPPAIGDEPELAGRARILEFREASRVRRVRIAEAAQEEFGRVVSWGATCQGLSLAFTMVSVPVMTRLGIRDRQVLDTLIDAGVARSRSEALAWCVRLVGQNEEAWISDLRAAFEHVETVRSRGPQSAPPEP
jgi:hypothetical protein